MSILVADVGGTNTRLALGDIKGLHLRDIQHFQNKDYASLYDVINAYPHGSIEAVCVAMAGPVSQNQGVLTNRDWHISATDLLAATKAKEAFLMNDLTALGYAAGHLSHDQLYSLRPKTGPSNGQSLVVGIGTGCNVCPFLMHHSATYPSEAEGGHITLPATVAYHLGDVSHAFPTVEDLFSGRGLAALHKALHGTPLDGREISERYATCDLAKQTLDTYARALGEMAREHALQYMPLDGLYYAGSVARGVLSGPAQAAFITTYERPSRFDHILKSIPMNIITEDAAPLTGCLVAAQFGISRSGE